ncbi:hypothetical protein [Streptomyces specialis]|uniref:hypothetical protein n=1 Tax=Streptomyces specialis TaxID=498367 RepID=UPI00073F0348|nr:hypothetical protein [Streptomyces specialis]
MSGQDGESQAAPTVKSVDDARAEASDVSSRILDVAAIQGQVSEPGPGVGICEDDPEKERLYTMDHPWSVSGLPRRTLEEAMDRLRAELPREGWEILEDGELDNANRTPRILFENTRIEYAAHVTIEGGDDDPRLHVSLVSACFSTPEGESPRNEY